VSATSPPRQVRVLLVEDDVPTRIGLRAIFAAEDDIEVVGESASGEDALALVEDLEPDVVLMDVQLPGIDGIETTERIAGTDGSPRVIVLTTFELDEYAYRSMQAGASGFLLKRAPAEEIVQSVRLVAAGTALPMPETHRRLIAQYAIGTRSSASRANVERLTDRESEVLVLIAHGMSNGEIAQELTISLDTVKSHAKRIFSKLEVRDRAQAVITAYESGLVSPGQ
jgi:DNA-binding NarL/FixJ family response regulator